MNNNINPLQILGKNFQQVQNILEHNGIEAIHDNLEDGEEQQYCVSAKNKTWEIHLGENNRIETIFLYLNCDRSGILGITKLMNSTDIIELLGEPTQSGEKVFIKVLDREYGSWERYDFDNYCIHIEHTLDNRGVKQITVMLPDIAP